MKSKTLLSLSLLLAAGASLAQPTQGVSPTEITLGTIQDLSGPIAAFGKQIRLGMTLRIEEANEQGGVHGRKLRLVVEDSAYDPKKAVLAAQKLVNQDKVFAVVAHIGTPTNMAAMPVQFEKNVFNFFPVSGGAELHEPPNESLKYAFLATNFDQMRIAAPRMVKMHNLKKPCVIFQDDDFGLEIVRGAEAGLKTVGAKFVEKTSYKRGATDFSTQVARMKAAGCDLVVLGTIIRETIGTVSEARKTDFNPVFVGTVGMYSDLIHKLGGKSMDGIYVAMAAQHPYLDSADKAIRFWANKYKTKFNEDPTVLSIYGYNAVDAFIKAAQKAGPELTRDSFTKAMDSIVIPRDIFGGPEMSFSPTRRLGSRYSRLSQLQEGRWVVVSDYAEFSGLKTIVQPDGRRRIVSEFFTD